MHLSGLLALIKDIPGYQQLRSKILEAESGRSEIVLSNAARPYIIAALHQDLALPVLVITAQTENAKRLLDQLQAWYATSTSLRFYPDTETLDRQSFVTNSINVNERLSTLSCLCKSAQLNNDKPLIIGSALAVASKTIPYESFFSSCHAIKTGITIDPLQLIKRWQNLGYELENLVELPGTISRRGGILDIFSPNNDLPARIEFFGNQVNSIRFFDPKTQRSSTFVPSITIVPANEQYHQAKGDTILDYMPAQTLMIIDDPDTVEATIDRAGDEPTGSLQTVKEHGEQSAGIGEFYLNWKEFKGKIEKIKTCLTLHSWNFNNGDTATSYSLPLSSVPSYGGRLEALSQALKELLKGDRRIVIVSQQTKRLAEVLQEHDILSNLDTQLDQLPPLGSVTLVQGSMAKGWEIKNVLTLLTDTEIFGIAKERRLSKKRPVRHHWLIPELTLGEYVVHIEHGIARFIGLTKMPTEGIQREYLVLEYAAGDRLYVPTDQVDRVSRYIGSSDQAPMLSRLGTQEWSRIKQRVKESVAEVAKELLSLYAAREVIPGFAFSPDNLWQQELEASFPYVETTDQMETVKAVKADMEKARPMDRLVCGDVGYGKTEVALRAAFKAVMDNKQVALLVPTTILAQQHYATFRARLQAFPLRLEMLSRFCSKKEQSEIIDGIANGTVDICIGTHRLLQKDVKFKDLGLAIIDEEQRFGVVHKEHFKGLRREVDVLTLSATPIPRTLHMSIVGIRDVSTMETPPEHRLPITTYVGAYEDRLIHKTILRELERNGQVFFVHNRVNSIFLVANRLQDLIPEARISVAHGQMSEEDLEKVIVTFASGNSDVLVTTTIIESGLDMPNVNTLIVDNADKLGLTQLYQLRGRVGRGDNHAYAYFLFGSRKQLTSEARKRLTTIAEATELGAGFGIAMRDLEIRGAGNILGVEQSGYIAALGFDLYCRLLSEAIEKVRGDRTKDHKREFLSTTLPTIDLPLAAHIPEEYIANQSTRISFYRKLAAVGRVDEINDLAQELIDRFGSIPQPLKNLLYVIEIRQLAAKAMIESISTEGECIKLHVSGTRTLGMASFGKYDGAIKVGTRQIRLDIKRLNHCWQKVLKEVIQTMVNI